MVHSPQFIQVLPGTWKGCDISIFLWGCGFISHPGPNRAANGSLSCVHWTPDFSTEAPVSLWTQPRGAGLLRVAPGRASHALCPGASEPTSGLSDEAHPAWPGPRPPGVSRHSPGVSPRLPGTSPWHSHFWSGYLFTMYWVSPRHWPQEGLGGARISAFCCQRALWGRSGGTHRARSQSREASVRRFSRAQRSEVISPRSHSSTWGPGEIQVRSVWCQSSSPPPTVSGRKGEKHNFPPLQAEWGGWWNLDTSDFHVPTLALVPYPTGWGTRRGYSPRKDSQMLWHVLSFCFLCSVFYDVLTP